MLEEPWPICRMQSSRISTIVLETRASYHLRVERGRRSRRLRRKRLPLDTADSDYSSHTNANNWPEEKRLL
jgi:hypothetical protein